jgi:hypothetical protein
MAYSRNARPNGMGILFGKKKEVCFVIPEVVTLLHLVTYTAVANAVTVNRGVS